MTVHKATENEPLVSVKKTTYSAITPRNDEISNGNGNGNYVSDDEFYLDKFGHVKQRRPDGGDANGHVTSEHTVSLPVDRITYTWQNMNVFCSASDTKRWWSIPWKRGRGVGGERRKHILKDLSGVAHPGELLAIMGASGAGKTTLLNTLMFRSGSGMVVNGKRAINGVPIDSSTLARLSAYVQQDDLFIGTLTVREHLIFHALVRMDRHIPYKQRMARVEEVISELVLSKCQDTVIGIPGRLKGISGGEMKRLSFASEVLTDPPIMFCDEPTSGLDSFMAQNVISVLKSMAEKGKTVVSTIHQPSSEVFAMFDKVLLMAEGRAAFLGTSADACAFFKELGAPCPMNYNPSDFFIQLLAVVPTREDACRATIEMVCDAFARSEAGVRLASDTIIPDVKSAVGTGGGWPDDYWQVGDTKHRSPYKASWWAQYRAVMWRSWLSVIKEPILMRVRVLQTIFTALLVGLIYMGQELDQDGAMNINGVLFIFLTTMTFQNIFACVTVFCSELPVFLREHFNGMYRTDVYFLCKTLAELPIFVMIPVLYTCVTYYMIGLNPDFFRFLMTCLIMILVANTATSFGYVCSCVSSNESMALSIGPPIVIPLLLFGGFFLNSGSIPSYFTWLSYLSWFKYGNEALMINQWVGVENITCTSLNATCPRTGEIILEVYGYADYDIWMNLISLMALIIGFRTVAYLALLAKTLKQR